MAWIGVAVALSAAAWACTVPAPEVERAVVPVPTLEATPEWAPAFPPRLYVVDRTQTSLAVVWGARSRATHFDVPQAEESPPPQNSRATGTPAIGGAARVGETLSVDTSGISDADGLDNASYTYQWLADDVDLSGATGSSYTLVDSDEGRAIKVRVSFTDDAGNAETVTSAATAAVAAAPEEERIAPLTASVSAAPGSHDGSVTFTFELRFSEETGDDFSYKTLRDHAFTVTGGVVVKARRLAPPSNVGWEITVRPDSNGTVTVVLPATTDCAAQGAICTGDGRMLSSRLEITVAGPGG